MDANNGNVHRRQSLGVIGGSDEGIDHRKGDEFGGEDEFYALANEAYEAGLGIVLDIVPNHMAVDDANRHWTDPELRAKFFDIEISTCSTSRGNSRRKLLSIA